MYNGRSTGTHLVSPPQNNLFVCALQPWISSLGKVEPSYKAFQQNLGHQDLGTGHFLVGILGTVDITVVSDCKYISMMPQSV